MACTSDNKKIAAVLAVYTGVQAIDGRVGDSEVYPAARGIDLFIISIFVSYWLAFRYGFHKPRARHYVLFVLKRGTQIRKRIRNFRTANSSRSDVVISGKPDVTVMHPIGNIPETSHLPNTLFT